MSVLTMARGLATDDDRRRHRRQRWVQWFFLITFAAVGFESLIIALAWKREMLVLLAPGVICIARAWETWREIKRVEREHEL